MKIQDAIKQNKEYWQENAKNLTSRLNNMQREVQKIAADLDEAQKQIQLYSKAEEILPTLEQAQVDMVKVVEGN